MRHAQSVEGHAPPEALQTPASLHTCRTSSIHLPPCPPVSQSVSQSVGQTSHLSACMVSFDTAVCGGGAAKTELFAGLTGGRCLLRSGQPLRHWGASSSSTLLGLGRLPSVECLQCRARPIVLAEAWSVRFGRGRMSPTLIRLTSIVFF
jgi:hypothetical protein